MSKDHVYDAYKPHNRCDVATLDNVCTGVTWAYLVYGAFVLRLRENMCKLLSIFCFELVEQSVIFSRLR